MQRGPNRRWGIEPHSLGLDTKIETKDLDKVLLAKFPSSPRIPFSFDPPKGSKNNTAYRPLKKGDIESLITQVATADYDQRRQLYESMDLIRFSHSDRQYDLSQLLKDPARIPEDQFNYALLWAMENGKTMNLKELIDALSQGRITSDLSRQLAVSLLSEHGDDTLNPLFAKLMLNDPSQNIRTTAALTLAKRATPTSYPFLKQGLESDSEMVRYAIAKGLQDHHDPRVLRFVTPLFNDSSFYVRRAAAMTAISLKDKAGIPVLLDTLQFDTLDTTDNYGNNLYNELAKYVGVNFGLDKAAWISWWEKTQDHFEFPQ